MSDQATGNRLQYPDHILWQGEKFGKLLAAAAVPLLLLPLDMADIAGDTGLPKGVMAGLAVPLIAFVVLMYYIYKHRKIAVSPQGMVLYGMTGTRRIGWGEIASVTVKLRQGSGEAPSSVTMAATRRDGGTTKLLVNFVAAPLLPWFAKDIKDTAAQWGIPCEVKGSRAARRAFERLEAEQAAVGYGTAQNPFVPPQQPVPPQPMQHQPQPPQMPHQPAPNQYTPPPQGHYAPPQAQYGQRPQGQTPWPPQG